MNAEQLKELAGRARRALAKTGIEITHAQSLDLIAAVAGLRNWPEVKSFPDRVAETVFGEASARRVAYRASNTHGCTEGPRWWHQQLLPRSRRGEPAPLVVWPGGPPAGVYLASSMKSAELAIDEYADATDGALHYGEPFHRTDDAIPLQEYGIHTDAVTRLPSGTLVTAGVDFRDPANRTTAVRCLTQTAYLALEHRLRCILVVATDQLKTVWQDARQLVEETRAPGSDIENGIVGVISEEGLWLPISDAAGPRDEAPPPEPSSTRH